MKKLIVSIMVVIIIGLCFYVGYLKNQVESRDMYIDYVNDETQEAISTLYELDMKQCINLNEGSIKVLNWVLKLHPDIQDH